MGRLDLPAGRMRGGAQLSGSRGRADSTIASGAMVLIVEDDEFVREVLADIVASFGFTVALAADGADAIEVYERAAEEIECVILDYDIPGTHSSRVVSHIRSINSGVKILLSSGYSESHVAGSFPLESVDGFIPKPYNTIMLRAELERISSAQ